MRRPGDHDLGIILRMRRLASLLILAMVTGSMSPVLMFGGKEYNITRKGSITVYIWA